MSKTAMQELIRIMEETIADNRCDIIIARAIKANIKLATELLDKEKEQIQDAWETGELFGERVERDGMNSQQVREARAEFLKAKTYNQ